MIDYSKAKIYKISNNNNKMIYIGSTCMELDRRIIGHKTSLKKGVNRPVYNMLRQMKVKPTQIKIGLIEKYPCKTKAQLRQRETYWIKKRKPKLNNNKAN